MDNPEKILKRAVVFHDLSGFSKCALSVAMPVLSAQKIEVLPVPTAVLSANMSIPGFSYLDMTPHLKEYLNHWKDIPVKADALYSGYLSAPEQTRYVEDSIDFLNPGLVLVDPVMGDGGRLYKSTNPLMRDGFLTLIKKADLLTPNLTEACLLTDMEYESDMNSEKTKELCERLKNLGAKNVVVTGVTRENALFNCVMTEKRYMEFGFMELPYRMGGTGDLFASVLLGKLLNGINLESAVPYSARFVTDVMAYTVGVDGYKQRGICFEPFLSLLC